MLGDGSECDLQLARSIRTKRTMRFPERRCSMSTGLRGIECKLLRMTRLNHFLKRSILIRKGRDLDSGRDALYESA
jgi:hypothetical protein